MKDSGKRISLAPWLAASSINRQVLSTQAARSNGGEAACTTATLTFDGESCMILPLCMVRTWIRSSELFDQMDIIDVSVIHWTYVCDLPVVIV
jgi:hypothetical protein